MRLSLLCSIFAWLILQLPNMRKMDWLNAFFPFLPTEFCIGPIYREIGSKHHHLLPALDLPFLSPPFCNCLWKNIVMSFHSWYWKLADIPLTLWLICVGNHNLVHCRKLYLSVSTLSPSFLVISVIFLGDGCFGGVKTDYVVILPESLVFIYFQLFFNLADVKKLLIFAFLDYMLVWTISQTFVSYLCFLLCKLCFRLDHLTIGVLWVVSKNIYCILKSLRNCSYHFWCKCFLTQFYIF